MSGRPKGGGLPHIPELADSWDLVRELGQGGTAVVYLARDRELSRDVAIKLIRSVYVRDEEAVARLEREARTVGKLQHPNIVMLLGTRRLSDGGLALILQYVPGRTLKERIQQEGPLPFDEAESILRDLARALSHAHRARIVHRDLKPENVYLDEGVGLARLADFGIARAWDSDSGLTLPGSALGTPAYMSPEQVDGRDVDGRSDLYSLGLLGYEMLTGRAPWEGENIYSIITKQKTEDLPPIGELRAGTPPHLVRILRKAMRKDPAERFQSAEAFLAALDGAGSVPAPVPEAPVAPLAPPPTGPPAAAARGKGLRDPRVTVSGLGALLLLLLVLAAVANPGGILDPLLSSEEGASSTASASPPADTDAGDAFPDPETPETAPAPPPPPDPGNAGFEVIQGGAQVGVAGRPLPAPVVLRLVGPDGTPLGGEEVLFQVVSGGGTVDPERGVSAPDGTLLARWTLGPEGEQRLRGAASTEAAGDLEILLEAGIRVPVPTEVAAAFEDPLAGEPGRPLPEPVEVRLLDERGEPIPGALVRFEAGEGSGTAAPSSTRTDAQGVARTTWTLGPEGAQPQRLVASAVDRPQATLTLEAGVRPLALAVRPGVFAGGTHSCLLAGNGVTTCWGGNDDGQLGDGSGARRLAPGAPLGGMSFARMSAGVSHSCALTGTGAAFCWGRNDQGQLGVGGGARSAPTAVSGAPGFTRIAAGLGHSCGLARDGVVHCWGGNGRGQLGDGSTERRGSPTPVSGDARFVEVVAGWNHTCALDAEGRAYCWGDGSEGQLGNGGTGNAATPRPVAGTARFRALAAGGTHTCGVSTAGRVLCWGANGFGQLGTGTSARATTPAPVASTGTYAGVTSGGAHSCALDGAGAASCWGRNLYGQLGDGTTEDRNRPTPVVGSLRFSDIHALGSHTCGRTTDGRTACWGFNVEGQLGVGSRDNRAEPTPVGGG